MHTAQNVSDPRRDEIVADSIRDHRRAVLTHRTAQGWRTYKSHFQSGSESAENVVLLLDTSEEELAIAPQVGQTIGVTFRLGQNKCGFSAVILEVRVPSVVLRWPDHLQQLQRRVFERASPPEGSIVAVRFWREDGTSGGVAGERHVRHGQLDDLSAGGMRIKVADPQDVELDQLYRCVFTAYPGAPAMVLEAVLRHREACDRGRASLGFQFIGLETTPDGRRVLERLARIVTQFHRANRRTTR